MALNEMLRALEEEASVRFEHIRRRAEAEAQALLDAASKGRIPIHDAAMAKARMTLAGERARRLSRAHFAVRKEIILLKEALIDEAFAAARERLRGIRQLGAYPVALQALTAEALRGVDGPVRVSIDPQDEEIIPELLAGVDCDIVPDLETSGGLRVLAGEARVSIDNTVETRLAKAETLLRSEVNRVLFGEEVV
jgi:vacuolar-type H+-ATPase subunit E/Vma4